MLGMVDRLEEEGFRAFGPRQNAAIIEGSKVFSKELMKKYGIPTAAYEVFDRSEDAINYIKAQNTFPTVIKAEGLALGKGVIIAENLEDAIAGVHEIMDDKVFGDAGKPRGYRGIPHRPRSLRPRVYRRENCQADGLRAGPQARL